MWPNATRAWELLSGATARFEESMTPLTRGLGGAKRDAEDAFGEDFKREANREPSGVYAPLTHRSANPLSGYGNQEMGTRLMAHMLGLDIPGVEPPTHSIPAQDWWFHTDDVMQNSPSSLLSPQQSEVRQTSNQAIFPITTPPVTSSTSNQWLQELAETNSAFGGFDFQGFTNPERH